MTRPRGLTAADPLLAVEGFFRWWLGELLPIAPKQWQHYFTRGETRILAVNRPPPIAGADAQQSNHYFSRMAGVHGSEGLVLVAPELVYQRTIALPLMSEWRLGKLIRFEAMRYDPMPSAQNYFDYRVADRDLASRLIYVDLFYIRQKSIDAANIFAAAHGLTVCGACVGSEDFSIRLPRLLRPPSYKGWLSKRQTHLLQRSAAVFAVLVIALTMLLVRIETAELSAQRNLEHLRAAFAATQPERRLRQSIIDEIDALNAERQKPLAIAVIAEITHLLPDSVWLTSMTNNDDSVEMHGFATKASDLVEVLSRSALFRDVRFNGPIAKDAQMNTERFDLRLRLGAGPR